MFEEYFNAIIIKTDRLYYNYVGINRKEFPKWEGWKLINKYKEDGIEAKEIKDERLDILVRNFYFLRYLSEKY